MNEINETYANGYNWDTFFNYYLEEKCTQTFWKYGESLTLKLVHLHCPAYLRPRKQAKSKTICWLISSL